MPYYKNISYTLSHLFLMLFLYLFNIHRYSKRKTKAICFCSFMTLNLTDICKLTIFADSNLCYVIITIFQILVTQLTGLLISEQRNSKVLFMGLSASNYVIAGSVTATILYIYTNSVFLSLLGSCFVFCSILIFLYLKIREIWLQQLQASPHQHNWSIKAKAKHNWLELCLIPCFFYCSFSFIAFFPHTLDENPDNIPGIVFFIITMFVSYAVVLRYIESETKKTEIFWQNILFESYIKGLEDQYHLVEKSEQNLKILRHDMRHYSEIIDALIDQKEYGEIKKITAHINTVSLENKVNKYCHHLLANAILSKMMDKAVYFSISVDLNAQIAKEIPVNDYEFTAVIANLFENALQSVKNLKQSKRKIKLKLFCNQERVFIQLINACEKKIYFDPNTGLPKSRQGENHGLGMSSVAAFAHKIKGTFDCCCENNMFKLILFAKF